jgi:UDP-glucose 4-epimerase
MLEGSVLDEGTVARAVEGADFVFNYAGIADIGEASSRPVETVRLNVLGNVMVLEACVKAKVRRYVFASSLYVYGKSGGFYRCSKQACEIYIENYQAMHDLPYTILRYGSLYGPRADNRNAIHRFVHEALTTGTITYYGAPTALREYVHVDDASAATLSVLDPSFENQHLIISGNQPMQVGDLFRMIGEMLGRPLDIRYQEDPNSGHYQITPYAFMPRMGRKLTPNLSVDLGQGILRVMEEEHRRLHPELTPEGGYLVPTDD